MLLNQLSRALNEIRSTEKTNIYIYIYLSSSAHFPSAGGLGHVPSPSLVSLKVQPPISNPFSTQAIFLFNATKSKVKIKPIVIPARGNKSYFFICPTLDHWCGYAMSVPGHSDASFAFFFLKGGLTRIFPTNTECKNCHQQESKNHTSTFFPDAFRAKRDSMWNMYPVEDCVKGLQGNSFKLYT